MLQVRPPLVLAYHSIGHVARKHDPYGLVVPPDRFSAHVERLRARGYEFVTQSAFARRLANSGPPAGVCALTFDDGGEDNATALPGLLAALGVPATLFVCPGLLGRPHPWLPGVRLMSAEELREIAELPSVEIGSHTNEHSDLAQADAEQAYREMASSKQAVEELVEKRVLSFAYPFCRYSPACPDAARRAGYTSAATCEGRGAWRPFELRREPILAFDTWITFELKTRGAFYPLLPSQLGRLARPGARRLLIGSRRP